MNARQAANESRLHAMEFGDDFADLVTCFPADAASKVLYSMAATSKRENEVCSYQDICRWFLDAYDRQILKADFRLSSIAREQLTEMRQKFAPETLPTQPAQTVPSAVTADGSIRVFAERDVNATDYSQMSKSAFDSINTFDARHLYKTNTSFRKRADHFWNGGK